jgi:diguanylate cyclase (GGDEF)-like protein
VTQQQAMQPPTMAKADLGWRDLALLAADLVFETDGEGRFVMLEPELVLGWRAADLLGQPAAALLLPDATGTDPFRPGAPIRRRRARLRRADGGTAALLFTAAPILNGAGRRLGARGLAQDATRQDAQEQEAAAAIRGADALDRMLGRLRAEVLPLRRTQAALDALRDALDAEGVALADAPPGAAPRGAAMPTIMPWARHRSGALTVSLAAALAVLDDDPAQGIATDGRPVAACPVLTRFGERVALAAWRPPGAAAWDVAALRLLGSAAAVLGAALEHEAMQRELARQMRNDPLTGLLNRRAFLDEVNRRIDRLDREDLHGTLLLLDLDEHESLADAEPDTADEALCVLARLLRATVRPADLVARLGSRSFGLWLDGADALTGAERAEALRLQAPQDLAQLAAATLPMTVSIGISCRRPSRGEDLDSLMRRATLALNDARPGGWRVSHADPA